MTTLPRGIWASWFRRLSRPPLRGRPAALEQSLANLNTRKRLRCLVTPAGPPPPAVAVTVGCPQVQWRPWSWCFVDLWEEESWIEDVACSLR